MQTMTIREKILARVAGKEVPKTLLIGGKRYVPVKAVSAVEPIKMVTHDGWKSLMITTDNFLLTEDVVVQMYQKLRQNHCPVHLSKEGAIVPLDGYELQTVPNDIDNTVVWKWRKKEVW